MAELSVVLTAEFDAPAHHLLLTVMAGWLKSFSDQISVITIHVAENAHFSRWCSTITYRAKVQFPTSERS